MVDVKLDARQLPDGVVTEQGFLGAAQDELLRRYPTAASATGDDRARMQRALIYLTAARLAPAIVRLTTITSQAQGASYTRETYDPAVRSAELRALAEIELAALLGEGQTASRPTLFSVASGQRGR